MELIKPVIHPKCFVDESPAGYLIRLSQLNRYDNYRWLFASEDRLTTITLYDLYKTLCKYRWTGFKRSHPFSEFRNLSYRYIQTPNIKICPDCIREKGYWDYRTHAVLHPVCIEHKRWRVDGCNRCKKRYSWRQGFIDQCSCGAIRDGESGTLSNPQLELATFIEGVEDEGIASNLDPSEFNYKTRCDLFLLLSRYVTKERRAGEFPRLTSVNELQECWGRVADVLFGSDDYLNAVMKQLHQSNPDFIKQFYREVQEFDQPSLAWFREQVITFVSRDLKTPISRQHRSLFHSKPETEIWMALQTVSREYAVPKSTLRQLADKGILERQIRVFDKRQQMLIYIESREKFTELVQNYVDFKTCAQLLGVTKLQLQSLVEKKYLKGFCKPDDQYSKWLIPKSSIEDFKGRLHKKKEERDTPPLLFRDALAHFSKGFDDLLISLVRAILGGQVTVISSGQAEYIRDIVIDREEFLEWRCQQLTQTGKISIVNLADRFAINQSAMYTIVNAGLIKAENHGKNSLNRLICESEVDRFEATYVFLSKVALASRRSSSAILGQLIRRGVQSINKSTKLKIYQTIYLRSEVAEHANLQDVLAEKLDWKLAYEVTRPGKVKK